MDINTVIIIIEKKKKKNATEFKIFQFKIFVLIRLHLVTSQNIALWDLKLFIVTSSFSYSTNLHIG